MDAFDILGNLIFVRIETYQLKSVMREIVFEYSKTAPAPLWLDSGNYSSVFYLITLMAEIDCSRKYGEQNNTFWTHKNYNMGIEECEYADHFWNGGRK